MKEGFLDQKRRAQNGSEVGVGSNGEEELDGRLRVFSSSEELFFLQRIPTELPKLATWLRAEYN